ncbi:bifunctional UDP-N-acetylglucosamine diphosphorylase/glucosamine-1-phosphate N-acetyltransferase GlmU [Corynebacterium uberis]|uniref:bifunctional UDP-N-acetylglucosamine diphosphorylase/glucosamine-1-phosphate N-acetyltransferase GlmU n=1 Tax=Corynebacterium sp. c6VSa_13 TaxID=2913496 RepID=UPI001D0B633D|nr:bifunctional UDP-N-acetylglucosamine diphosphorylase/glucosamine-1-phosphate N-acetyltransferase GlmU [Corynebacterium uberis]UDL72633.1 bifunctional UDP-N-acetylglucosamine diphosphorylase/glucosamine-1-phosphate N-acetyltransferase GlmU [Corynebacterium uberis]UDL76491.1 bifunctional UDP-N-acetylglucosamine diphosphorylase/glucosamine-1-phosphate N-acetyltransferase GlmU [Corynebacterium uberis]UDL78703.1 bifunctional UDP-N-acetylglucosamine diphosphorylase/glucosamine-1-phosphate N-acetylt
MPTENNTEFTPPSCAVIVLAAGAGTRMKSATQKTLHEIGGRTLLSHSLHAAAGMDPTSIVAVVGHQRDQVTPAVEKVAQELNRPVAVAIQEEQKGTGHAVQCALGQLDGFSGTVIVTNGDVPLLRPETLARLARAHTQSPTAVTVLTLELDDPTGYGRIVRNEAGEVTAIVEQKDASDAEKAIHEVNSGVFAFDADVLRDALGRITADNAQGELYLTDVLAIARGDGLAVRAHVAEDSEELAGVNDRVQLAAAGKVLNRRTVEAAMRGGATIIDPDTTFIDVTVSVGQDVTIEPGTQLRGTTTIADGATIGPDTTLVDMTIGAGASVVRTHGLSSEIGPNATVGPFTYIRPGTVLGEDGKLGGFVEAKNAQIGRGSKVPHLTYVGDATIGEESNIGASSVFVNYDGVNKHHTTVGSHVRTGSDTMFIAPVTVGDGAYSGAGTVIRQDVPAGALVVSGGPQRIIEGWVEKKRPGSPAAQAAQRARSASESHSGTDQEG